MLKSVIKFHGNGQKERECQVDEHDDYHGECKSWYENGQLHSHCFFNNGDHHGEFKRWDILGYLERHDFDCHNAEITDEVTALVEDVLNITEEEKMLIKLTWGIPCLN